MLQRLQETGNRYGWGVMVAAAPYVNLLCVITAGLGCWLLVVVSSLFNVYPNPPSETWNPISWMLYTLILGCYGWYVWSILALWLMVPLGLAWSLADVLIGKVRGEGDRMIGGIAGLTLGLIPLLFWLRSDTNAQTALLAANGFGAFNAFVRQFIVAPAWYLADRLPVSSIGSWPAVDNAVLGPIGNLLDGIFARGCKG